MSNVPRVEYTSSDEDSRRWAAYRFRSGDIVISARSKSGTTWVQMICGLLIFEKAVLPAPLAELSPWIDHSIEPIADVVQRLERQRHRRFVKTHTPLDGVPIDARASYVVVARHPLDMAVSLYHQSDNIDRRRLRELTRAPIPAEADTPAEPRSAVRDWLLRWIEREATPQESMDSLPGVVHHAADAWARRERPNVVLTHYADLRADLAGEMRRLAAELELTPAWLQDCPGIRRWDELVDAAGFNAMRAHAGALVPDRLGVLRESGAFFRRGSSGAGRELLSDAELRGYEERISGLATPEVLGWLNR